MHRESSGRMSPARVLLIAFLGALLAQALFLACVEKQKDNIDTSEPGDDTQSGEQTICGRSFDNYILPFFEKYCNRCHSSVEVGDVRRGAPASSNFDTLDEIEAQHDKIRASLLDDSGMPPTAPFPQTEERDNIIAWIDCGVDTNWQAP